MSTNNTALVPADDPNDDAIAVPAGFGSLLSAPDADRMASWDLTTAKGRELLQRCEEEQDKKVRELINLEIEVEHIYCKRIPDFADPETGEIRPILRISLVTPDGKVYGCSANGVRESILRLSQGRGFPPWKPAVKVRVSQKPGRGANQRLVLLEIFPQPKGKS